MIYKGFSFKKFGSQFGEKHAHIIPLAVMRQKVIERVIWINKIVASRKNIPPKSQNAENQKNVG